ncbi:hypothetical protein QT231_18325 [Halomonas sp. SpR1]|uniref:hypothetical protein n=1 Tax=Halomonas sp. SpR1 TaxID=3050462 RepID=UPI0027E4B431|nr:hypothetical protein [Halomonas sp. SpR1]MDQ7734670.1 hypothetical protein [Halomonas sp. SpR1]
MNISDVLNGNFDIGAQLEQLADELEAAGEKFGAALIRREIRGLGGRLRDLDTVLNINKVQMYAMQEEGNSQAARRWLSMIEGGVA